MMFETRAVPLVNAIANHPDIRPTVEQGSRYLDFGILMDEDHIFYANSYGLVLFVRKDEGEYDIHAGFLKLGRGRFAKESILSALEQLKRRHGAKTVVAKIPLQLRAARLLCRLVGFASQGAAGPSEIFIYEGGRNGRID